MWVLALTYAEGLICWRWICVFGKRHQNTVIGRKAAPVSVLPFLNPFWFRLFLKCPYIFGKARLRGDRNEKMLFPETTYTIEKCANTAGNLLKTVYNGF